MLKYVDNSNTINQFENISELYNWLKVTQRRPKADNSSEDLDREYWSGSKSLEDAYNLLLGGDMDLYNEFIKAKDLKMEKQFACLVPRKKTKYDIVGGNVDVPSYLVGIPNCMVNREKTLVKSKVLNIMLNITVSAGVDSDDIKKLGTKYLQVIELLEKVGYRCNLYVGICAHNLSDYLTCLVRIKTDREPLNIKKCVFPMVHPSMFRRVMFNWLEKCEIQSGREITNNGYGSPVQDQNVIKNQIKDKIHRDYIVWGFQNCEYTKIGVDKILEELKTKYGITIGNNS